MLKQFSLILAVLFSGAAKAEPKAVKVDGSSTVFPISEGVAEEFHKTNKDIRVTIGNSGTGGGFKKFLAKEVDICDASRPITEKELAEAKANKIEFIELPVAIDGLSVVVNSKNNFIDSISIADLKKIWEPGSAVKKWSDVNPKWPKEDIALFGPGTDHGTFDYFTEHVIGKAKSIRQDHTSAMDMNVIVKGVISNKNALAYFGHSFYKANEKKVKALAIDAGKGKGAVAPTDANVSSRTYPLSRLIYIYVNKDALKKPETLKFVDFYLKNMNEMDTAVGYLPLTKELKAEVDKKFEKAKG